MSAITFSAREMEVLALAWQCMEQQPKVSISPPRTSTSTRLAPTPLFLSHTHTNPLQIDMNKLATLTGYTPGSAAVTFGNIKRKIKLLGEGLAADGPATPKKGAGAGRPKASATPKKRGTSTAAADDESPTKRAKKTSSTKETRKDHEDEDDEDFAPKVKKEELADLNQAANDFYGQLQGAAQAEFEQSF
jgi:hypothetical protein